jgi:hypothetical protein
MHGLADGSCFDFETWTPLLLVNITTVVSPSHSTKAIIGTYETAPVYTVSLREV